ncbi:UNVERIFIED_CONTAM: hypothetical protein K2H54_063211, partial [Gekko kuhli]
MKPPSDIRWRPLSRGIGQESDQGATSPGDRRTPVAFASSPSLHDGVETASVKVEQ